MGIKEGAWEINWGNAILWAIGFIVAKDVIFGQTRLFNLYEMFGFWITTIGEFIFVLLIVILVKLFGVKKYIQLPITNATKSSILWQNITNT